MSGLGSDAGSLSSASENDLADDDNLLADALLLSPRAGSPRAGSPRAGSPQRPGLDPGETRGSGWSLSKVDAQSSDARGNVGSMRPSGISASRKASVEQEEEEEEEKDAIVALASDSDASGNDFKARARSVSSDASSIAAIQQANASDEKPALLQLPEEMWGEMVSVATGCWGRCLGELRVNATDVFEELGAMTGCMPLEPRSDPDLAFSQLLKDIKRETIEVDGKLFEGGSAFDELYGALETIILRDNEALLGIELEHRVQRLFRGCSRTVTGYDAFGVVSALLAQTPAMVTPAMMNNSPIQIETNMAARLVTVTTTNVFKVSHELRDGCLAAVVILKTQLTEQIELESWRTVRWMSLKPLDPAEECLNPVLLFKERTLAALLSQTITDSSSTLSDGADSAGNCRLAHNKQVLGIIADARSAMELAIAQSLKSIRELTHAEYLRGHQDATDAAAANARTALPTLSISKLISSVSGPSSPTTPKSAI